MPDEKPPCHSRPTLRIIAREAGLSLTATSMAMRNHPGISLESRDRVQAIAQKLGYHRDPKLSMLMQHLRTQHTSQYHETLAYLSPFGDYRWKAFSQHDYYLGASELAAESGYRLEIFHLGAAGMTPHRMSQLLVARGIRGVLIGGGEDIAVFTGMNWSRFAVVTFSYSLLTPDHHRATTDYYRGMLSALSRLRGEGCRRIGLHVKIQDDTKTSNLWRSAYLFYDYEIPKKERVPIHTVHEVSGDLDGWLKKYRPDAIISAGCDFPQDYERAHRKAPPSTIAYVNMNIFHADSRSRGIDQDSYEVGRLGCGHLIVMLQRNEVGLPSRPQIMSVEGKWIENYQEWFQSLAKKTRPRIVAAAAASQKARALR